jgi:hypothetical protein
MIAGGGASAWSMGSVESVGSVAIGASVDIVVSERVAEFKDVSAKPQPADNSIIAVDSMLITLFDTFFILPPLF